MRCLRLRGSRSAQVSVVYVTRALRRALAPGQVLTTARATPVRVKTTVDTPRGGPGRPPPGCCRGRTRRGCHRAEILTRPLSGAPLWIRVCARGSRRAGSPSEVHPAAGCGGVLTAKSRLTTINQRRRPRQRRASRTGGDAPRRHHTNPIQDHPEVRPLHTTAVDVTGHADGRRFGQLGTRSCRGHCVGAVRCDSSGAAARP